MSGHPVGELTALPQTSWLYLRALLLGDGKGERMKFGACKISSKPDRLPLQHDSGPIP